MTEILAQLRMDLLTALCHYQQLFKDRPMPDVRCRDMNRIIYIINDGSHQHYQDCINAVEKYIAGIRTTWWPLCKQSRLRNSIQSVLDDYQHPEIQALIERIELFQGYQKGDHYKPANQSLSVFSQWTAHLSEKIKLINKLQDTLIKIRYEKSKQVKVNGSIYDHFRYLVRHPDNECL